MMDHFQYYNRVNELCSAFYSKITEVRLFGVDGQYLTISYYTRPNRLRNILVDKDTTRFCIKDKIYLTNDEAAINKLKVALYNREIESVIENL